MLTPINPLCDFCREDGTCDEDIFAGLEALETKVFNGVIFHRASDAGVSCLQDYRSRLTRPLIPQVSCPHTPGAEQTE